MAIYSKRNLRDYLIYLPIFQVRKLNPTEVNLPKVTFLVTTWKRLSSVLHHSLNVSNIINTMFPVHMADYMCYYNHSYSSFSFHLVGKYIYKCIHFIWIICTLYSIYLVTLSFKIKCIFIWMGLTYLFGNRKLIKSVSQYLNFLLIAVCVKNHSPYICIGSIIRCLYSIYT